MVPPHWQHPMGDRGAPQSMFDQHFDDAFAEWLADFDRIRSGELSDCERTCYAKPGMSPLAQWIGDAGVPPDRRYYRPWRDGEGTWFQVWENVSEGSPVTPAFATQEELVDYLVDYGDDSEGRRVAWDRETAAEFVASRYRQISDRNLRRISDRDPESRR
jgi:hypothetical protein